MAYGTDIAGVRNSFLVTGEGTTTFTNETSNEITITNSENEFTLSYLPTLSGVPSDSNVQFSLPLMRVML